MSNSSMPNDIQYRVYSDSKMDEICEKDSIDVAELINNDTGLQICQQYCAIHLAMSSMISDRRFYALTNLIMNSLRLYG